MPRQKRGNTPKQGGARDTRLSREPLVTCSLIRFPITFVSPSSRSPPSPSSSPARSSSSARRDETKTPSGPEPEGASGKHNNRHTLFLSARQRPFPSRISSARSDARPALPARLYPRHISRLAGCHARRVAPDSRHQRRLPCGILMMTQEKNPLRGGARSSGLRARVEIHRSAKRDVHRSVFRAYKRVTGTRVCTSYITASEGEIAKTRASNARKNGRAFDFTRAKQSMSREAKLSPARTLISGPGRKKIDSAQRIKATGKHGAPRKNQSIDHANTTSDEKRQ